MPTPRDRRLQADYEKVLKLVAESGETLKLLRTTGSPPTWYEIEYHCPGLVKDAEGQISIHNFHRVVIVLMANYPFEKPNARVTTPVFNPHVYPHDAICLGVVWNAAETLDTLVLRIGALLQLDPRVLNANSPANSEANQWVKQHPDRIPLGTISFKTAQTPKSQVQWR